MDSLGDVLKHKKVPVEAEESRLIKAYVANRYKVQPLVLVQEHSLTIIVSNAALAGTIRLELPQIVVECKLTKKVYIRIN